VVLRLLAPSLVATALLGAGCGRPESTIAPAPQDPAVLIEQFMAAVKANDLSTLGNLWGTAKGPASRTMARDDRSREDLHKRLVIIQSYLAHESYRIVPGTPATPSGEPLVQVQLTRRGCTPVVPFTLVRYREGWLVSSIDLAAAGNPAIPCS
jgi:hypothetical protein